MVHFIAFITSCACCMLLNALVACVNCNFSYSNNKCRQRTAPSYLFEELCQPADLEARRHLRSASSSSLVVRRTRLSTVGDRAFPVAAATIWNGLPPHVTSAPSLPVFRSRLKTHLFRHCFAWLHLLFFVVPVKWLVIIGHVNRSFYLLTYLLITVLISWSFDSWIICAVSCVNWPFHFMIHNFL